MEVMEDGNLMDKIQILIQRDMEYYKVHIIIAPVLWNSFNFFLCRRNKRYYKRKYARA